MWLILAVAVVCSAVFLFCELRQEPLAQAAQPPSIDRSTRLCLPLVEFYRMTPLPKCGIRICEQSLSFSIFDGRLNCLVSDFCNAEGDRFLTGNTSPLTAAGRRHMNDLHSYIREVFGTAALSTLRSSLLELYPDPIDRHTVTVRLSISVTPATAANLMCYYEQCCGSWEHAFYDLLDPPS